MKLNKILLITIITLVFIASLSCASAMENTTTDNSLKSNQINIDSDWQELENGINEIDDGGSIYLNTNLNANSEIKIDKNISIIGNNNQIKGMGDANLFNINSEVKLINITFTNTSSFIINNQGKTVVENCTFTDLYENVINNTNELIIINSTFKNIKSLHLNPNVASLSKYYNNSGVIYNTGTMSITNSKFNNIILPTIITYNSNMSVKKEGIIYNLNTGTITNTSFTNITGIRAINNTGKLSVKNTNFNNISTYGYTVTFQTASGYAQNINKGINGLGIYNSNEMILENITMNNMRIQYRYITSIGTYVYPEQVTNNGTGIYNVGTMTINNSRFDELYAVNYGGAIRNDGKLMLFNSTIFNTQSKNAGGIHNTGEMIIENSIINQTSGEYGRAIINSGNMTISKTIIDKIRSMVTQDFAPVVNTESGNCTITDSILKNNKIGYVAYWPFIFFGIVYNEGTMNITRCIFDNNTAKGKYAYVGGSYNIYNRGNLTAQYNLFLNCHLNEIIISPSSFHVGTDPYAYAMEDDGNTNFNYNYYDYNQDPYMNYTNFEIHQYFVLAIEPEYYALEIGETANITATLKLDNGHYFEDYSKLPDINITFVINDETTIIVPLIDGKASIEFNRSQAKGSNYVKAILGQYPLETQVDVGKEYCQMDVVAEEIYYGDTAVFEMTVTGNYTHQPKGEVSIIIDGKKYTAKLKNNKATLRLENLIPKTYDLKIVYEGDEDYFKSIFHKNYTVHKRPTNMTMSIPEIYYGDVGIATITLKPSGVANQAYMYINGDRKTIYLRDTTDIKLRNYAAGEYNITVVLWENRYYESSNATAIFRVNKYPTTLTVNTTDIMVNETAILNVTLGPEEVAGEAKLIINNHTEIIYLNNGENNITLNNLSGGRYTITVLFEGDKKYLPSNDTVILNVKRQETNITAEIINGEIIVTSMDNLTGILDIYINDQVYKTNITNGKAVFKANFTSAENYIFILFEANSEYEYTTTNLTYEYISLVNLTGYDNTTYGEITYHVILCDENGYGIGNRTIIVNLNNEIYTLTTDSSGLAKLTPALDVGEYSVTATYRNLTFKNTLKVLEDAVLTGENIKAYSQDSFPFTVMLTDHNGIPLSTRTVNITINSQIYTAKTDASGEAKITLKLTKGTYNITSRYNGVSTTNRITIIDYELLFGQDVRTYENTQFNYSVTLTDDDRNPLVNQTITFTVNNQTYTEITDSIGIATIALSLKNGNYTVTARWNNITAKNILEIIEDCILTGFDVRAYADSDFNYTVILTDHNSNPLADKTIRFVINNRQYTYTTDSSGRAYLNLNLAEGNYTIVSYYKDFKVENTLEILVEYYLNGNNVRMYAYEDFDYKVNLTDKNNLGIANKEITYTLNGKTYKSTTDLNGVATLTLSLAEGTYNITSVYKGAVLNNVFEILPAYRLFSRDVEMFYKDGSRFVARLTDPRGSPIANETITIEINGVKYNKTVDSDGYTSIPLNLNSNKYMVTTSYKNLSNTNLVTIKTTIAGNDIVKMFRNATQYSATFYNTKGELLINTDITFNINGVYYTRTTDSNGVARLNINLNPETYIITATNPVNGEMHTNTVKVLSLLAENKDVVKYYRNGTQYVVRVLDESGNPVGAGETVTFNINGIFYTRQTDSDGYVRLNLNLVPGNYIITAEYKNCRVSNNIEILSVLFANDLIKNTSSNEPFQVILYNDVGRPLARTNIEFNVNGMTYTRATNVIGIVTLNVNLPVGEYIITSSYNGASISNKIIITP